MVAVTAVQPRLSVSEDLLQKALDLLQKALDLLRSNTRKEGIYSPHTQLKPGGVLKECREVYAGSRPDDNLVEFSLKEPETQIRNGSRKTLGLSKFNV